MKKCILYLIICICVCACKVPRGAPLIEYRDRLQIDTVTMTDSVYVSRYVREKGDTVFVTDTLFKFKYRDKVKEIRVHDSIPYEVQVQVPVRVRNGYDRFTSWFFWIVVVLVLIRLVWWIVKKYYLRV